MDLPFPSPGETFAEKYRIEAELGRGGFARVYKATRLDLETDVAIKVMRPHLLLEGDQFEGETDEAQGLDALVTRFKQEAKTISRLRSVETVNMHDYGRTGDGMLYMVLEYIDGRTLGEVIREEQALSAERVVDIVEQVARGLFEAHALGVLHRDIKPGNIMLYEHLGQKDRVKVLDFGIGKVIGEAGELTQHNLTADNRLLGTPRYLSPEYIRNAGLTPASDIYSLGLVAFELLTGEHAVDATSSVQMLGQHLDPTPFVLPEGLDVPDGLRQIVHKMVVKDPARRYRTIDELLADLRAYKHGDDATVGLLVPAQGGPMPSPTKRSGLPRVLSSVPPGRLLWGVGVSVFTLALVFAFLLVEPGGAPRGTKRAAETHGDNAAPPAESAPARTEESAEVVPKADPERQAKSEHEANAPAMPAGAEEAQRNPERPAEPQEPANKPASEQADQSDDERSTRQGSPRRVHRKPAVEEASDLLADEDEDEKPVYLPVE